jgi:mono/diheme cytochrome c family protein
MSQRQVRSQSSYSSSGPGSGRETAWRAALTAAGLLALGLCGCQAEKRAIGPAPPVSTPNGVADRRQHAYETNAFELAEGGRWFRWYGCGQCHAEDSQGPAKLTDDVWRSGGTTAEIYRAIAAGRPPRMPAYGARMAPQQAWQLAAYVRGLHRLKPQVRQRQADAQAGEPSDGRWGGALR